MSVGFVLLPKIIWMMYEMLYQISPIDISFNFKYGGIGLILISICIIGATIYTIARELKNTPANLMRPKAPKMGKRVLLEKIPFIWKHLSFSRKVTIRNIFRYKKRFLMTIIGIFGCTSLIVAGFGLRDSIKSLMPSQYEKVFNYDFQINLKSELTEEQINNYVQEELKKEEKIQKVAKTYMTSTTIKNGELEQDVQIIVPETLEELEGLINIKDLETEEKISLKENEICLTDKAAQLINVKKGDKIILKDSDDKEIEVTISNIVENYVSHYIYMSKTTYENLYQEKYKTNVIFTQNKELSEEEENDLATDIMKQSEVSSISRINTAMKMMDDTMNSLNYVVIILIVSARTTCICSTI